jgi:hypothetical protein
MRWLTTAVLAILFAGLATFYYVYEIRQGPAREQAAARKDRVWPEVEAKDVDDVRITRGAETIHLQKSGDAWSLVAPRPARADTRAVDDLVNALAIARVERELEASPAKVDDFGLAPPAVEVTFKAKGETRGLRLGAKNPTGIWVYAQRTDKPAVFLAPDSLLREAQKGANDFRDRTVLAFERKDVTGLEVKPAGGAPVAARKTGEDEWQLTAPLAARADREQVSGLLEKLRGARIKEFVADAAPDPKAAAGYGLDRPLSLTLWLGEEKSRSAKTLRFGRTDPDRKGVYAQREGEPGVFLVEEELLKTVPASGMALRDKTVFAYDRSKLERVEVEGPKGKVALALADGVWRITAPTELRADDNATNVLLGRARDLKALDFVAETADRLAAYGLDRPQVRLTVWEKEAKEPRALVLAPVPGKDTAYATVAGAGPAPVVTVDGKALADLARSVQDLRDRSLFGAFDTRGVTGVRIQRGDQTLSLERRGEDDWRLVGPKSGKARSGRVTDVVWTLRNLKWRELIAEQGWDEARYGLAPPATTITLTGKDGKTVAALALGRTEAGDVYVRVPDQPALYAVESKSLGDIPATPEDVLL